MIAERRYWIIGNVFLGVLLLLSLRIAYWQLVRGDDFALTPSDPQRFAESTVKTIEKDPYVTAETVMDYLAGRTGPNEIPQPVLQRWADQLARSQRGAIYDRNGRPLAFDAPNPDGSVTRWYSEPSLSPTLGYVTGVRSGAAGLEASYNSTLLGLDGLEGALSQVLRQPLTGSDLTLTIDSAVQRAAVAALGGRAGAILAVDGETGAILALASAPSYDANQVLTPGYLESLPGQAPLLNRVTQGLYPPGSTWKTVTLIASLDIHQIPPDFVFDFGQPRQGPDGPYYVYEVDGAVIPDPNHRESKLSLGMAYAKSANAAFARMGAEMAPRTFVDYATRLGFSAPDPARFPAEIDYSPSLLARDPGALLTNNVLRASTAIGQGELLVTPLQMAMVGLSVLNDGRLPLPYLVESVREPGGLVIPGRLKGETLRGLYRPETARIVKEMMVGVVTEGAGAGAVVEGAVVGGKTGTAQLGGSDQPHAWFLGFAETEERSVVIAVILENGGSGSRNAAPVFAQVAAAALFQQGEPVPEVVPGIPTVVE